jgi:hypothetical protein
MIEEEGEGRDKKERERNKLRGKKKFERTQRETDFGPQRISIEGQLIGQ